MKENGIAKRIASLTYFERWLWVCSVIGVLSAYFFSRLLGTEGDLLSTVASLIGVTALIFVAKADVLGQILTVIFAVFYGAASFHLRYYGEMITYLCMSAPMAILAVISWIRHPHGKGFEARIERLRLKQILLLFLSTIAVTVLFYFLLRYLGNASLVVSTFSITTSFLAAGLTFLRSPYYALAYALNDVVLILLWGIAVFSDVSYLPMLICFLLFFVNDLYGFWNWKRMQKRQMEEISQKPIGS